MAPSIQITESVVNTRLITENWADLIRLAGSLKLGHLKAAGVMRVLQVKDRPTTLAKALSQLGRIIKTLHILNYIDDPVFRRRILSQLNRQELRHKLGRRIHLGDRGEIRSPLRQGQEEQFGALGLALNSVVHWNAVYMQEALSQLANRAVAIDPADIAGCLRSSGATSISSGSTSSICPKPSRKEGSGRSVNLLPSGTFEKQYQPL